MARLTNSLALVIRQSSRACPPSGTRHPEVLELQENVEPCRIRREIPKATVWQSHNERRQQLAAA